MILTQQSRWWRRREIGGERWAQKEVPRETRGGDIHRRRNTWLPTLGILLVPWRFCNWEFSSTGREERRWIFQYITASSRQLLAETSSYLSLSRMQPKQIKLNCRIFLICWRNIDNNNTINPSHVTTHVPSHAGPVLQLNLFLLLYPSQLNYI